MFMGDESSFHGLMAPRKLIVFKHQSALGNSPAHQLFDRVTVKLKEKVKAERRAPRPFADDYDVTVNRNGLSKTVELIELL
jgi:CRISPR-associated protein Csd2